MLKMSHVELPIFITKSLIQDVYERNYAEGKTLVVMKYWAEWGTKKGDNYASEMYRIHVTYSVNDIIRNKAILLKVNSISIKFLGK